MVQGPLAGNHPRKVRVYALADGLVSVVPDPSPSWPNKIRYYVNLDGETVGAIVYRSERYTRGWQGQSFMPHGGRWEGSKARRSGHAGELVPLGDGTFMGCVKAFPAAFLQGKFPSPEQVTARLEAVDRDNAAKEAERAAERDERAAQRELDAAMAEAERLETLEGLQSIRANLGAALTNYEAAALAAAIERFGG